MLDAWYPLRRVGRRPGEHTGGRHYFSVTAWLGTPLLVRELATPVETFMREASTAGPIRAVKSPSYCFQILPNKHAGSPPRVTAWQVCGEHDHEMDPLRTFPSLHRRTKEAVISGKGVFIFPDKQGSAMKIGGLDISSHRVSASNLVLQGYVLITRKGVRRTRCLTQAYHE